MHHGFLMPVTSHSSLHVPAVYSSSSRLIPPLHPLPRYSEKHSNPDFKGAWAGYNPEALGSALYPNEVSSDFAFIPFGGGARKCIGDQVWGVCVGGDRWGRWQGVGFFIQ